MRPLDPGELVWLEEARELLRGPGVDLRDVGWLGAQLDVLMAVWHETPPVARWNPRPTTTALGITTGDAVIARVPGLQWVQLLEPGASRFALAHPATASLGHPLEAVEAAWAAGRPGALRPLVDRLAAEATGRTRASRTHVADEPARRSGALRLLGLRR